MKRFMILLLLLFSLSSCSWLVGVQTGVGGMQGNPYRRIVSPIGQPPLRKGQIYVINGAPLLAYCLRVQARKQAKKSN